MAIDSDRLEDFSAFVRKHETTIRRISGSFYPVDSYDYIQMVCDLSTYLWLAFRSLPSDVDIHDEHAWVFVILHHHALNLVRDENWRQERLVYDADLTDLADDVEPDPLVDRLYRLIAELDKDDKEIILMYVDNVPIKQIALNRGMSYLNAYRRIASIQNKLRRLNDIVDDNDDDTLA